MKIQFINNGVEKKWNNYRRFCKPIYEKAMMYSPYAKSKESATLVLVNDEQIHEMNLTYRNIDRPTDVLTFMDQEDETYLGDIFINVDALVRQSIDYENTLKREFCFLFTHGMLHLLGYDHHTEAEEREMFGLQEEILYEIAPKTRR